MYRVYIPHTLARISLWAFLAIFSGFPYVIDVVYPWDLCPSHFAQERIGNAEKSDPSEIKSHFARADIQRDMAVSSRLAWDAIPHWSLHEVKSADPTPSPLLAILTFSRPPPAL